MEYIQYKNVQTFDECENKDKTKIKKGKKWMETYPKPVTKQMNYGVEFLRT